jgi:hypothetical protein
VLGHRTLTEQVFNGTYGEGKPVPELLPAVDLATFKHVAALVRCQPPSGQHTASANAAVDSTPEQRGKESDDGRGQLQTSHSGGASLRDFCECACAAPWCRFTAALSA